LVNGVALVGHLPWIELPTPGIPHCRETGDERKAPKSSETVKVAEKCPVGRGKKGIRQNRGQVARSQPCRWENL
jgi:hypothetical protein